MRKALLLTGVLALAGCASDAPERPLPSAYYGCQDGTGIFVIFEPAAAVVRVGPAKPVRLAQQRAASGMWYRASNYELRGAGDTATWTAQGRAPTECEVK